MPHINYDMQYWSILCSYINHYIPVWINPPLEWWWQYASSQTVALALQSLVQWRFQGEQGAGKWGMPDCWTAGEMKILAISVPRHTVSREWDILHCVWRQINVMCLTCTIFHSGARAATAWDATEQSAPMMRISVSLLLVTCSTKPRTAAILLHCRKPFLWDLHYRTISRVPWPTQLNAFQLLIYICLCTLNNECSFCMDTLCIYCTLGALLSRSVVVVVGVATTVVSPVATCAGGVFPSTHWQRYQTYTQATCTVWWYTLCIYCTFGRTLYSMVCILRVELHCTILI